MTKLSKELGNRAETLAANLLQTKRQKILARNLRTKFGEIDILSQDGKMLVITEVKAKTSSQFGSAIEMITHAKAEKLILLAHELRSTYQTNAVRIDVVTVDDATSDPIIRHHKGVIEYHG